MPVTINGSNTPTAGGITYGDGTTYANTAAGTAGQVLLSAGASAPAWTAQSALSVGSATTATTATNLAGGSNGTIPYQSAAGTTQMLAVGTAGQVLQTNGAGAPTWVTVASGLSGASQAQMEAASSTTVAVTPAVAQYHPSAAKCWIKCTRTTNQASYNVASISDLGTGSVQVTMTTSFSSANYAVSAALLASGGTSVLTLNVWTQTAGTFILNSYESSSGTSSNAVSFFASCFGDQA